MIAALRRLRMTGAEIAEVLGMAQTTVSGILTRIGMGRLGRVGLEPAQRYERARPGELIHVDVKKLGRIEGGAGWRVRDPKQHYNRTFIDSDGFRRRTVGWEYVHIAIDDATRLAYVEVLGDEKANTAVGFLGRAVRFFRRYGIKVQRVLTDNGAPYRSTITRSPVAFSASSTCAPSPTAPRPTGRPSASSARCSPAGPTAPSTAPAPSAPRPLTAGCGATTMSVPTAPSAASRPQLDSPS